MKSIALIVLGGLGLITSGGGLVSGTFNSGGESGGVNLTCVGVIIFLVSGALLRWGIQLLKGDGWTG